MKYVLHGYREDDGYFKDTMTATADTQQKAIKEASKSIKQKAADLVVIIRKFDGKTWTVT